MNCQASFVPVFRHHIPQSRSLYADFSSLHPPSIQLINQSPVLAMGAFEFFAQFLMEGIVRRHGRRAGYVREQSAMSGVHPLLGSLDLFSRGHDEVNCGSGQSSQKFPSS